jgi:hypothetical protein
MDRQLIETELGVELPSQFENYSPTLQQSIVEYIKHLDVIEKQAYKIGKSHLGTSFNVIKSNGYINWKKTQK